MTGEARALAALRRALEEFAPTEKWKRDVTAEERGRPTGLDATAFHYLGTAAPEALVVLVWGEEGAEVSNIVPKDAGRLTHDQYNSIAQWFVEDVLNPHAARNVRVELGPCEETIDDLLNAPTADALRAFSLGANKSTGSAHPLDAERWRKFVILAHVAGASLDATTLQRWLEEEEEWPEEQAQELAIEYEQARDLLAQYDEEREGH